MSLRDDIQRLARELDEEGNAAWDLWTWLPSHSKARNHHGEYASEHRPDVADVMREASMYLADLQDGGTRAVDFWESCPCGLHHEDPSTANE